MKKYLAMALACILMLLGAAALAEGTAAAESTDLLTQILEIGYDETEAAAIQDALAGEWYATCIGINSGWGWDLLDTEDLYSTYIFDIHEDGSVAVYNVDYPPVDWNVKIAGKGVMSENYAGETFETPVIEVQFLDTVGGYFSCFLVEEEYSVMMEYLGIPGWSLFAPQGQSPMNVYFTKYYDAADMPAPMRTDVSIEEFNGKWELVSADFMGRTINYYGVPLGRTEPGMICEIDIGAGYCAINYLTDPWQASSLSELEDGRLTAYNPEFGIHREYVGCSIREDDTLYVNHHGLHMTFQRLKIDPLTEYSDKDTIQRVQTAMNSLGYECGTPDGIAGKKTAAAISAFQTDSDLTVTGTITEETLQFLRGNGVI